MEKDMEPIKSPLTRKVEFLPYSDLVKALESVPDPSKEPLRYFLECHTTTEISRKARKRDVRGIVRFFLGKEEITDDELYGFPFHQITFKHVVVFYNYSLTKYKNTTANQRLGTLKSVLKCFMLAGWMSSSEIDKISMIKTIGCITKPAGRLVTIEEMSLCLKFWDYRMRNNLSNYMVANRNMSILSLAWSTGLRISEIEGLLLTDYNPEENSIEVTCGKGRKYRKVYLGDITEEYLKSWLDVSIRQAKFLYTSYNSIKDVMTRNKLRSKNIAKMIKFTYQGVGIDRFSCHDLRRTYISNLLSAGVDPITVAKLAGHSRISTTMIYDRRPEETRRSTRNITDVEYST